MFRFATEMTYMTKETMHGMKKHGLTFVCKYRIDGKK